MGLRSGYPEWLPVWPPSAPSPPPGEQPGVGHEQLVVAADRERISRDLHDVVIQRIYATALALQSVADQIEPPEAARRVNLAIDQLDLVIAEIRTTIFALSSSSPSGLRRRVLRVIAEAAPSLGHDPTARLEGPLDTAVPDDVGGHLLAVLCEALSNVARHAQATRTDIVVRVTSWVTVQVADNGVGLSGAVRDSGLRNLRHRAQALGGGMTISGGAGQGTSMQWQVPLTR